MQQSHLYDSSLIMLESKDNGSIAFGFAVRSYPQLMMSQFFKRREFRMQNLFGGAHSIELGFDNIDQVLTNEVLALRTHMKSLKGDFSLNGESLVSQLECKD